MFMFHLLLGFTRAETLREPALSGHGPGDQIPIRQPLQPFKVTTMDNRQPKPQETGTLD